MIEWKAKIAELERELVTAARYGEPLAIGWLTLASFRIRSELPRRLRVALERFVRASDVWDFRRNAGALVVARWYARRDETFELPPDFEDRLWSMFVDLLRSTGHHAISVLSDYAQAPLIALAPPEPCRELVREHFLHVRGGVPCRRVFMSEALRLMGDPVGMTEFDPDRIDSADALALCWERFRLTSEAPRDLLERALGADTRARWHLKAALLETLEGLQRTGGVSAGGPEAGHGFAG